MDWNGLESGESIKLPGTQVGDLNGFNIIFVTLKHFKIIINRMALTVSAAQ